MAMFWVGLTGFRMGCVAVGMIGTNCVNCIRSSTEVRLSTVPSASYNEGYVRFREEVALLEVITGISTHRSRLQKHRGDSEFRVRRIPIESRWKASDH